MVDAEPDNNTGKEDNGAPESKQERRIIQLVNGEQSVTVDGPDDLKTMAELAAYFWLLTSPTQKVSTGFSAGSTLVTERAEPYYESRGGGGDADEMG
jgi:hypothetical protein